MIKHEMRYCGTCRGSRPVRIKKPNHVLHLLLTICTGGLWIIVWGFAIGEAAFARPGRCPECNGRVK